MEKNNPAENVSPIKKHGEFPASHLVFFGFFLGGYVMIFLPKSLSMNEHFWNTTSCWSLIAMKNLREHFFCE